MQNPQSSSHFKPLGRKSQSVDNGTPSRNNAKRAATVEPNHHIKLEDNSIREAQITSENQTLVLSEEMPHPVSEVETLHTPTLILTIKLGKDFQAVEQDKVQMLQISEQDPPTTIAALFCKKHGLDQEVETALASKIEDSIANLNAVEVPCPEPGPTVSPPPPQRDEDVRMSGSTMSFLKDMDLNHLYAMNDKYDDPMKSRQRFMNQIVSEISGTSEVKACTFKPSLSKNTEKIAKEKSKRIMSPDDSVHQRLYRDAISRKKSAAALSPPFSPSDSIYSQSPKIKEKRMMERTVEENEEAHPEDPIYVKSEAEEISHVKISQFLSTTSVVPPNPVMDMSTTNFSHALLNPNSISNTSSYSGQRMYLNSAKNLHQKQQKLKKMKKELEDKQVKEATFKPVINTRSRQMLPERQNKSTKTEILLLEAGAKRAAKVKAMKEDMDEKSKKALPFSPHISKSSQMKAKAKRPQNVRQSVHDNLFNEAKKKDRELNEEIRKSSERFSFKPHISRGPRDASSQQVHKRLYVNASMKELSVKVEPQIAPKPQISRGPRKSHRNGDNVFKYLFAEERDRSKSLEERRVAQENQLVKKVQQKNYQISRSQEILTNVKDKRITELFKKLDINNDGLISESSIDITGLNQLELKAIESVLMPLEQTGSEMNYEQFYSSVNHALPHLEPELKNALVGPHHSRKLAASSDLSFKPSINKKSSSLANLRNSRRPSEGSIWGFLSAQQKIIEEKKKETEKLRMQNQLKGCTFSPDIAPSPLYRSTQASFRSEKGRNSPKGGAKSFIYPSKAPRREVLLPQSST